MANVKISDLPAASTPLTGTELVPIVQSGVTSQVTTEDVSLAVLPTLAANSGASLVGYLPSGTGAVETTVQTKLRETVSVFDFMTAAQIADVQAGTASIDVTAAIQAAIAATPTNGTLHFPAGTYKAVVSIRKSYISVVGAGSASTIIKTPAGVDSNVFELGETAWVGSPTAYSHINVSGITFDGNKANVPTPTTDLTGWGMPVTNCSYCTWSDLKAINCKSGGFGIFINSNHNTGNNLYSEGVSGTVASGYGLDLNSIQNNTFNNFISNNDNYGIRVLDNNSNVYVQGIVYNASKVGVNLGSVDVNTGEYGNTINVTVSGGCIYNGIQMAWHSRGYNLTATVSKTTGSGAFYMIKSSTYIASGNVINLSTYQNQGYAAQIDGDNNIVNVSSYDDGLSETGVYALIVGGNYNQITTNIYSAAATTRSIDVSTGAIENNFISFQEINVLSYIDDKGTRTKIGFQEGFGVDIASASTVIVPQQGTFFNVTGTTTISTLVVAGTMRKQFTLIFSGAVSVVNAGAIKLAGAFTSTAGSTLTLVYDGTNCYEISRSIH